MTEEREPVELHAALGKSCSDLVFIGAWRPEREHFPGFGLWLNKLDLWRGTVYCIKASLKSLNWGNWGRDVPGCVSTIIASSPAPLNSVTNLSPTTIKVGSVPFRAPFWLLCGTEWAVGFQVPFCGCYPHFLLLNFLVSGIQNFQNTVMRKQYLCMKNTTAPGVQSSPFSSQLRISHFGYVLTLLNLSCVSTHNMFK